jgi:hypothetical protein
MASLNICLEACFGNGWGQAEYHSPPLIYTLFPSWSVDASFQDDVTICVSSCCFPIGQLWFICPSHWWSYHSHISTGYWVISMIILAPYWEANICLAASLATSITSYQSYVAVSLVNGHVNNLLPALWLVRTDLLVNLSGLRSYWRHPHPSSSFVSPGLSSRRIGYVS